jgi:hypothetical protein
VGGLLEVRWAPQGHLQALRRHVQRQEAPGAAPPGLGGADNFNILCELAAAAFHLSPPLRLRSFGCSGRCSCISRERQRVGREYRGIDFSLVQVSMYRFIGGIDISIDTFRYDPDH